MIEFSPGLSDFRISESRLPVKRKAYAKTWEENAAPKTHDPIARVVAKIEKPKQVDRTWNYLEILRRM